MFNHKQINLVIREHVIRYVVTSQPTIDKIIDYGEVFLEPGIIEDGKIVNESSLQSILLNLVRVKKWKNKRIAFCVPDSFVTIREQLVPKQLTKDEVKKYIQMELEESIRLPFTNPVFDFVKVGEDEEQTKLQLFAYPKERLDDFLNLFYRTGLKPIIADISSLSLYRLYHQLNISKDKEHLLSIQWNKDAIVLTAFHEHQPKFTRHVSLPYTTEYWNSTDKGLTWVHTEQELDQLIEEQLLTIERFMDFYQYSIMNGESQFTNILLVGDFPQLNKIAEMITERYNLPVEMLKKWEEQSTYSTKYFEVIGLSVKNSSK